MSMALTHFHAVMIDETGCEFGAGIDASTRYEAYDLLRDMYPESRIDQLESPDDTARREAETYARVSAEWDDEMGYSEEEDF